MSHHRAIGMVDPMVKPMAETVVKTMIKSVVEPVVKPMVEAIVVEPAPSKTGAVPPKAQTKDAPRITAITPSISRLPAIAIVRNIIPITVRGELIIGIRVGWRSLRPDIRLGVIRLCICLRRIRCKGWDLIAGNGPGRQRHAGRLAQISVMIQHFSDQCSRNSNLLQMNDRVRR